MRAIVPFAVSFCLAACAARAPAPEPAAPAPATADTATKLPQVDIPYTRFTLANGLTVLVHEDRKAPLVAVSVWYHVGSKDEPDKRHGFAHLFEHLMFNGSQHYNDEYFRALEPAGATDINGSTNVDRTEYHETVPTAALDLALWLESDRMGYLTGAIDQAKLDEQRGVVLNEKREGENRPYGNVEEIQSRESYPSGHPYSWTTIGNEADLNAATLADVKAWFKRWYGPNNAVLTLAGDIDAAQAKALAEKYFGGIPPADPVTHVRDWPAPRHGDKRVVVNDDVPLPRLYLGWNVPGDGERDNVLLSLAADVLSSRKSGRLYERLVYRDQTAASIGADVEGDEIAGQFQIVATAKPGASLAPIESAVREELARLLADGPTDDELRPIKTLRYAGMIAGFDSVGEKAGLLGANQVFHDDPAHYRIELDWLNQATAADVRDAARRWLGDGRLAIEVLPQPARKVAPGTVDRSRPPALAAAAPLALPPFQRATLANGLKLVVVPRPGLPEVIFDMVFDAGRAADGGGKSGVAAVTLAMLDEGVAAAPGNPVGPLDALALSRRQSELGATLGASNGREASRVSLWALKPNLAPSLDLYTAVLRAPSFPPEELARIQQRTLAAIAQEKASAGGIVGRIASGLLYGPDHAYSFKGLGDEKVIAGLTREELIAFRERWLRPDNATLVIVGDTTLAEVQPLIEARFGDWAAPAAALPRKAIAAVPPATTSRVVLVDKPGATQSLVVAENIAVPASDPDAEAMDTVNTALGGQFISRLNLNLREGKHWSYGAGSGVTDSNGPQVFQAQANIERDHTADAMREMKQEFTALLGKRPLTPAEIAAAKQSLILALPGGFETAGEVDSAVVSLVELHRPDDYWNRLAPQIEGQSVAQLKSAAAKMVRPEAMLWIVVGDLDKIEPSIRKLGFGEVQVVDADGRRLR